MDANFEDTFSRGTAQSIIALHWFLSVRISVRVCVYLLTYLAGSFSGLFIHPSSTATKV